MFLNRGDGSFQARSDYRTGGFDTRSVAIGDLNGDPRADLATADFGANRVFVLLNATGICAVPNLKGTALPRARRAIARAGCRVGKLRRVYSETIKRGRVLSQKPGFGAVLLNGGKVNLVISLGRNR